MAHGKWSVYTQRTEYFGNFGRKKLIEGEYRDGIRDGEWKIFLGTRAVYVTYLDVMQVEFRDWDGLKLDLDEPTEVKTEQAIDLAEATRKGYLSRVNLLLEQAGLP